MARRAGLHRGRRGSRELIGKTARDLFASQKLLDDLCDWLAETGPVKSGQKIEGHF